VTALDAAREFRERGALLRDLGRYEEALAHFERALAHDPNDADTMLYVASTLSDLGRLDAALAAVDRGVALAPEHEWGYRLRSHILGALRRHEEAIEAARRAVALAPELCEAQLRLAYCARRLKRFEEAREATTRAIACNPSNPHVWTSQAYLAKEMRQPDLERESHRRALQLDPGDPAKLVNYALLMPLADREALLRRALSLDAGYKRAVDELRNALSMSGKHDEAIALAQRDFALQPDDRVAWRTLIAVAVFGGRADVAETARYQAEKKEHDMKEFTADLALCARDWSRADALYADALACSPCCCCLAKRALLALALDERGRACAMRESHPGCNCGHMQRLELALAPRG
jgi:tetratricopeptide (TPR) repeat protein